MKRFLVTCDPGLEDIAEGEIKKKLKAKVKRFFNFQGKLLVDLKSPKKLFTLHSLHHIIELKKTFFLRKKTLDELYEKIKRTDIDELEKAGSFRVTSKRFGQHSFTSVQIQDICGRALQEKYRKKVDLKNFDVNIRIDVVGNLCFVGIQHTKESLYKRFKKSFNHPAAIKSTIAYGMLCLAGIKKRDTLLDPMCGSGTIVLEAASLFKDKIKIIAGDINKEYVKGAEENARLNGLKKFIEFKRIDATKLEKYFEKADKIDKIVTNPPYGIKIGKRKNLRKLYRNFLVSASKILSDSGRMVVINLRAEMFRIAVIRTKLFKVVHERVVESGGLYPHIFVLEKI